MDGNTIAEQATSSVITLGTGSIVVLDSVVLKSGPAIAGTLTAEQEARVRAELSGTVLGTYVQQGRASRAELNQEILDQLRDWVGERARRMFGSGHAKPRQEPIPDPVGGGVD